MKEQHNSSLCDVRMRGPDVHVTGYDPEPATDQWSCDCSQHARKSKACISVRVSSRPLRNISQVIMITRKEEWWSMGVGWWVNVPSIELNKKGAPCWGAVIPVAEMAYSDWSVSTFLHRNTFSPLVSSPHSWCLGPGHSCTDIHYTPLVCSPTGLGKSDLTGEV